MSEPFDRMVEALQTYGVKVQTRNPKHVMAQCPVHEDQQPSLSVSDSTDKVLLRCHAGCANADIVDALGLELRDLFEQVPEVRSRHGVVERSYLYETATGEPWFYKDRYFPKQFIQRLPGTEPGDRSGLRGRQPVLYHLPRLIAGMRAGHPVYLVEGEKDVEACERHGLVATTTPGGAGASWQEAYTTCLRGASKVIIVADQDPRKDDGTLGAGHQHADAARAALRAASVPVEVVAPASGKDASDHFDAGYGPEDFKKDEALILRPRGMRGDRLLEAEFPPLRWAVDHIVPEGLTILAGSPKAGKSWVALSMGLATAAGGRALSGLTAQQGDVLFLAREDGYRRLQSRLDLLMEGDEAQYLNRIELLPSEVEWVGGEIGLAAMSEWADEVDDPRMVVLDTLAKVEPQADDRDRYRADYSMMSAYKRWADDHHCAVVVVHHDRKASSEDGDPFTRISGTKGITGAADTMLFLETKRGTNEGQLHVTGRDVAEQSLDLRRVGPLWQAVSLPEQVFIPRRRLA